MLIGAIVAAIESLQIPEQYATFLICHSEYGKLLRALKESKAKVTRPSASAIESCLSYKPFSEGEQAF